MESLESGSFGLSLDHVQPLSQMSLGNGDGFDLETFISFQLEKRANDPDLASSVPPAVLEVDSYQIAVPNGDCSVHLLVDRSTWEGQNSNWGTIKKSILMDGGNDGRGRTSGTARILQRAIRLIRSKYDNDTNDMPADVIKFDSWVVTHWDNDHWGGSLRLFRDSIRNGQCIYMRYNSKDPLTILYCPNWTRLPVYLSRMGANDKLRKKAEKNMKKKPNQLIIKAADLDQAEANGMGLVDLNYDGVQVEGLCVAKWGHRILLGTDFFTGQTCSGLFTPGENQDLSLEKALNETLSSFKMVETALQLFQDSPHQSQPRFICVGAGGFLLGGIISKDQVNAALAESLEPADTWANLSSIMSVLHFSKQKHISLYWGGDAVTVMEESFVKHRNDRPPFFQGYTVTVVKWSHHGGRHSNPAALWDMLKPTRCVVSANRTGQYLHPHPEVLTRFADYCQKRFGSSHGARWSDCLFSTYYPGWILNPKPGAIKSNGGQVSWDNKLRLWRTIWYGLSPIQADLVARHAQKVLTDNNGLDQMIHDPHRDMYQPVVAGNVVGRTDYQVLFLHILSSCNAADSNVAANDANTALRGPDGKITVWVEDYRKTANLNLSVDMSFVDASAWSADFDHQRAEQALEPLAYRSKEFEASFSELNAAADGNYTARRHSSDNVANFQYAEFVDHESPLFYTHSGVNSNISNNPYGVDLGGQAKEFSFNWKSQELDNSQLYNQTGLQYNSGAFLEQLRQDNLSNPLMPQQAVTMPSHLGYGWESNPTHAGTGIEYNSGSFLEQLRRQGGLSSPFMGQKGVSMPPQLGEYGGGEFNNPFIGNRDNEQGSHVSKPPGRGGQSRKKIPFVKVGQPGKKGRSYEEAISPQDSSEDEELQPQKVFLKDDGEEVEGNVLPG
ncbi:hypothetical protein QBC44DRAFT_313167 [Cladorrhinum sp. PSN332]|nr:hypothetical protein QBC44DRAFT_313167 [Cladorrhinum sp. PSN332]